MTLKNMERKKKKNNNKANHHLRENVVGPGWVQAVTCSGVV